MFQDRRQRRPSLLGCAGGLLAAAAIGLAAYASHGAQGHVQANLHTAALYAFGHGVALATLSGGTLRNLGRAALYALLFGTLLFCGSLVAGALAGFSTRAAPIGGVTMMLAWVAWAIDALRR
ncbi:MAG: DUF423 domain-containing protein [Pseudoxanthomonas sp.]